MVENITFIGVILSTGALIVSIYSIYKRRETQRQLEILRGQVDEKEELRNLSAELKDLEDDCTSILNIIKNPMNSVETDLWGQLDLLSKEILKIHHSTGQPSNVVLFEMTAGTGDDEVVIENPQDAIQAMERGLRIWVGIIITTSGADDVLYRLEDCLWNHSYAYDALESLQKNYSGILKQFDSGLLDDTKSILDAILLGIVGSLLMNREGREFTPENFDNSDEMALAIFEYFVKYDTLDSDLKEVTEIIDRIEEVRKATVQASYS